MNELTSKQSEVLQYIRDHVQQHQRPPTRREIAEHFGFNAMAAQRHVENLEAKGAIQRDRGARALRLTR